MFKNPYLFVYGSLRQGFNSPAYDYIFRYFQLIGNASSKGIMVDLGQFPAVVPTTENKYVVGELYKIKNENEMSWAFAQLDDYEGVLAESNEQPLYIRSLTDVKCNDNIVTANVYWYNGDVHHLPIIESGDIFEYIKTKKLIEP